MLNSKTWIIIGIIITLALGVILGMAMDQSIRFKHRRWAKEEITQEYLLARLSRKLDLTITQVQAIGGILRMQAVKLKTARDDFRGKMKTIREETLEMIKLHLTTQQQEKYAKLVQSHRKRWQRICSKE